MMDTRTAGIGGLAVAVIAATVGVAGAQNPLPMGSPAGGTARGARRPSTP